MVAAHFGAQSCNVSYSGIGVVFNAPIPGLLRRGTAEAAAFGAADVRSDTRGRHTARVDPLRTRAVWFLPQSLFRPSLCVAELVRSCGPWCVVYVVPRA